MNTVEYVKDFRELDVYQRLYKLMVMVHNEIIPHLPDSERFNLIDQMRRASQAAPALLAEGFAKRFQPKNWGKYFNDTIGEIQEMIHHVSTAKDLYAKIVDQRVCETVIDEYTVCIKQVNRLGFTVKKMPR